jgi:hypothetical protein
VRVRLTKLRPFSGSRSTCSWLTVVPSSELLVCTSVVCASIVTASETVPTSSLKSMRTFWSTPSGMFDCAIFLKPESSAVAE